VLPKLTGEDLISIGATSVGHRRKLLDAIAGLGTTVPTAVATAPALLHYARGTRSHRIACCQRFVQTFFGVGARRWQKIRTCLRGTIRRWAAFE
jgi:hypothetical protein